MGNSFTGQLETYTHAVLNTPCPKAAWNCFLFGVAQQLQINTEKNVWKMGYQKDE